MADFSSRMNYEIMKHSFPSVDNANLGLNNSDILRQPNLKIPKYLACVLNTDKLC